MAIYDSAKIRYAATLIDRLVDCMETDVKTGLRTASECRESFQGRTAQAMDERLNYLLRTADDLERELGTLARRISTYADMLERADEQLAEEL